MQERSLPQAFPLLPYLALSGILAVAGEIVYRLHMILGLAIFALGIMPIVLTGLVMLAVKPWVSLSSEGVSWRYLVGRETVPWSSLRRIGRVEHPAGGFRLFGEVSAEAFRDCPLGRLRRGLAGPSGACGKELVRVWLPVGKLMHFCRVGSTRYLPAALRRLNPTLEMSERGLDGAWGRYRLVLSAIVLAWLAAIIILGLI